MEIDSWIGINVAIFVALLIIQILLTFMIERHGAKWSLKRAGNSVLLTVPFIVTITGVLITNSFSGISFIPRGISNSEPISNLEEAEKRINDLELQTEYFETYLEHDRRRQLILVSGLSGVFLLSLFVVGLGMYKPKEQTSGPRTYE